MTINWYGQSCFKIQGKEVTLVTDPFDKSIGLNPPRVRADIVTVSHQHPDHNNLGVIKENPFIINGPGEYSVKGVTVLGISSFHDAQRGKERGLNTIYVIEMGDIRLGHLGDLGHLLSDRQLEMVNGIDILMIPVGGVYTIDAQKAGEVINQIDPRIVIPMHYQTPGLTLKIDKLDKFLKEMAVSPSPVTKLTIKKKELSQEKTEVVVMKVG